MHFMKGCGWMEMRWRMQDVRCRMYAIDGWIEDWILDWLHSCDSILINARDGGVIRWYPFSLTSERKRGH